MDWASSVFVLTIVSIAKAEHTENNIEKVDINFLAKSVLETLGVSGNDSSKYKKLEKKLSKVNSYVLDKEKYGELIMNETKISKLNETNFFNALTEPDDFRFLSEKEPKSLFVKLKEKMNRDDIQKILNARGSKNGSLLQSARKFLDFQEDAEDEELDDAIDKLLAESPRDDHKFNRDDVESPYWDPQGELEELAEQHKRDGRRIFRGERTTIKNFPFVVSVHVMGMFWCGGALYWHDLVLTSAACLQLMHNNRFFRENPRILAVRIGSNHSRIGGELVDASEVYFHPGYSPKTLKNNIAVIRLRYHIKFDYHRVPKLVAISHYDNLVPATGEVMVFGWGVTRTSQKLRYEPIFLQTKVLPVYPNIFCKQVYGDKFVTETMFCAGTMTTGEGACDHDAGGPAIMSGKLYGIISFGPTICGFPNAPTVFTLVGAFADWIETVNASMPLYYRAKKRTTTTTPRPRFTFPSEEKIKQIPLFDPKRTTVEEILAETTEVEDTEVATPTTEATEALRKKRRKKKKKKGPFVLVH